MSKLKSDFHRSFLLTFAIHLAFSHSTSSSSKEEKLEHFVNFQRILLDEPSTECRHFVLEQGQKVASAILSPQNLVETSGPNITIIGCVKGVHIPKDGSALLHVLDSQTHLGSNPVVFSKDECSIAWQDVPYGSYEIFVQVLDVSGIEINRSPLVHFSRFPKSKSPSGNLLNQAHAMDRDTMYHASSITPQHPAVPSRDQDTDDWPIMSTLRAMASGPASMPTASTPTASPRVHPPAFCGIRGWEEVSVHEVMASFLQSEWYKEEHAEWRSDARAHAAVMRPNISHDNDNVLRAMLLATPRKVSRVLASSVCAVLGISPCAWSRREAHVNLERRAAA
jgi:hypothetical protein